MKQDNKHHSYSYAQTNSLPSTHIKKDTMEQNEGNNASTGASNTIKRNKIKKKI